MLRIFANWCTENANDIELAPWECLDEDMTLFDVVYLDIVHGFDVPYNVLMEYVNKGWSGDLISRLGHCYGCVKIDKRKHVSENKYSFHFKTFLLMQQAIGLGYYASIETILTCVALLIENDEYAIASRVLESGADELWKCDVSIRFEDVFASIVSSKTTNDLRESSTISGQEFDIKFFRMSVRIFFCYASCVCYTNLKNGKRLAEVLIRMSTYLIGLVKNDKALPDYIDFLLFLEVHEYESRMRVFYHNHCMFEKTELIKEIADFEQEFPGSRLFCSCNAKIGMESNMFLGSLNDSKYTPVLDSLENRIARHTKSTADRMYHALVLICVNKYEQATALLNAIIDEEGDYSLSVVICQNRIWESNFLDDNLSKELKQLSTDYVVIPSILFARYLLVKVSISLGRIEQWQRNMTEFNILRQRYDLSGSDYMEPILNALSKSLER